VIPFLLVIGDADGTPITKNRLTREKLNRFMELRLCMT
jgi:hypothetical protein